MKQFRGGPVFKAHGFLYYSTLGSRVMMKKKGGRLRDSPGIHPIPGPPSFAALTLPLPHSEKSVSISISEQLIDRNVKRFRGGLVLKAHRRLYHSALGVTPPLSRAGLLPSISIFRFNISILGFRALGSGARVQGSGRSADCIKSEKERFLEILQTLLHITRVLTPFFVFPNPKP